MSTNIKEIAAKANVSPATVSRVFSGNATVKEGTKARILAIATELGYSPRKAGRPVEAKESFQRIGLVIPTVRNTYYSEIIGGIESFLKPLGIRLVTCCVDEQPEKELEYLTILKKMGISGIILVPSLNIYDETVVLLSEMENSGTPLVLLDRDIRQATFDGVFMDNYSGAFHSTMALMNRGHKNIAFLEGNPEISGALDCFRGYREALSSQGIPLREEYILQGDYNFDTAYRVVKTCYSEHPEITAVFSSSQRMALGCIFAFEELGLHIGEDISIICNGRPDVGFDFISHASYPISDVGRECGRILYGKMVYGMESTSVRRRIFFDMKMYLRGSENYRGNL